MSANKWLVFVIMAITLLYEIGPKNNKNKKYCIVITTIVLTCFSGFRCWKMGDLFHYCYTYLECNTLEWKLDFSSRDTIGIQLFFRIAGQLGISFETCLFLIAAFTAVAIGVLIYRYSPSPYWSYLMYLTMGFYLLSFNALKQIIAMDILIYAMSASINRKPIQFLILVMMASAFHTPALVFLLVYPIAYKKINFWMIAVITMVIFLFRDSIVSRISEVYYGSDMEFEASEIIGGKVIFMILILVLALILRPLSESDKLYCQVFNIMILATIVQTFSVYDNVFSRLAEYFLQFIILLVPLMLQSRKERVRASSENLEIVRYWSNRTLLFVGVGITIFSVAFYFYNINASADLLNSYKFFWEVDIPNSRELLAETLKVYGGV